MIIEALKALLIGIVEGITEWLPISSTGHMILVDEFVKLQVSPDFLALFLVVIQIGAIRRRAHPVLPQAQPLLAPQDARPRRRARGACGGWSSIGCIPGRHPRLRA